MYYKEKEMLLGIIDDFVNMKPSEPPKDINWDIVATYVDRQQLSAIVYYQYKKQGQVIKSLESSFYSQVARSVVEKKLLTEIDDAFAKNDISYMVLKGMEVATIYPCTSLRTMGDIDILIHQEDRDRAHCVLTEMKYVAQNNFENEWSYAKNNHAVELHYNLLTELASAGHTPGIQNFLSDLWDHCDSYDSSARSHLKWEYHLVYLLIHMRQHLMGGGIGIRQFMDVAVVINQKQLDWQLIEKLLSNVDLFRFAQVVFSLCNHWFKVDTPIKGSIDGAFYDEVFEKVTEGGVFGHFDESNSINMVTNHTNRRGKIGATLFNLFPSYAYCRTQKQYAFVAGKPYLTPIAWVLRIFNSIKSGNTIVAVKNALVPFTQNEKIEKRNQYLQNWGL